MTRIDPELRKGWMSLLAKTKPERLAELFVLLAPEPPYIWLRTPECGGVMLRGRAGGTGAPFNLGEMTVTRCALRLETGEVGHAYVQGRDQAHATRAALVDALMQTDQAPQIEATVLAPLRVQRQAATTRRAEKAAATKVEFFTLVRGED